ncbi:MAG: TonB-dependent receptor [Kofleriaceae bacterium]|nr:TonB-dependent receptor [Kofleriaceae bacterium]MBP6839396.1 TonB-dependent receptor [Kofleriaceae bacterium]
MNSKQWFVAAALGAASLLGSQLVVTSEAAAQSSTTGAVQGTVKDEATGEALIGVTVVASSTALQGTQTAITDENGSYKISNLPPGDYIITFYYADLEIRRSGINIGLNRVTPVYQKLNQNAAGGEVVEITERAPTIDPTSTSQGITLDQEYTKNIPIPGRTFDAALGAAAGSQGDALGVAFSGSSSLENQYIVDGVNTTGLQFGTVGSPVINDFIEEIEVITGGYNAEYGRATGGVVNVVTKSGTNEFKGSVFGAMTSGFLALDRERTPTQASSIDAETNLVYSADFGFELGGPIIKDKVWFWVGFGPQLGKLDITRRTKRRTDCRRVDASGNLGECDLTNGQDGQPDRDPDTNFLVFEDVDSSKLASTSLNYSILGKVNFAVKPEHQGQASVIAAPGSAEQQFIYGIPEQIRYDVRGMTLDTAFKWTSKFNDNKTEVEAVVGWHRETIKADAIDKSLNSQRLQQLIFGNLGTWSRLGGESELTELGCTDGGPDDPYPLIDNCPDEGVGYAFGGPGGITDEKSERRSIRLGVTQRAKLLGSHEIKLGGDVEDNRFNNSRLISGGATLLNYLGQYVMASRWVQLAPMGTTDERFDNRCSGSGMEDVSGNEIEFQCDYLAGEVGYPGTDVAGSTFNWSAYVRDSWQIQPNLTINAGLRYEEQRLRYAEALQGQIDPLTGNQLGKDAMVMKGMLAPRLGALYDWTKEGRSKIYTSWGRFYESIPLQINDRSFGGEVFYRQYFAVDGQGNQCGAVNDDIGGVDGNNCLNDETQVPGVAEELLGSSGVLVAPGLKPQYMDEILFGAEYELLDDLKFGVSLQSRKLGRVIEDVSTDGANTYIIANPGEWAQSEEDKLQTEIDQTVDPSERARLERQLELYQGIRLFDKPQRDYNALQFTLTRRFSKSLYLQGSYTYSRVRGNFPGLISYDNGQVDPNISSQYDLIELLANRNGPLPQERPHYIKLDGYYSFDLKKAGELTLGMRFRALSGVPIDALAPHYTYGPDESFLLPRGVIGRTDFEHGLDLHLGYGRDLGRGMNLEVYADLFNAYNRQGTASVDETYAIAVRNSNANPISGGSYEDLIFAKSIDDSGAETNTPVVRNPNFRNTAGRYSPLSSQFGLRLTF